MEQSFFIKLIIVVYLCVDVTKEMMKGNICGPYAQPLERSHLK
jgi:hypothetical protein